MKSKLLVLLLMVSFPALAERTVEDNVQQQLNQYPKSFIALGCSNSITKYKDKLKKDPDSEYYVWKLLKTYESCGEQLSRKDYKEKGVELKKQHSKMLNEKASRQQLESK